MPNIKFQLMALNIFIALRSDHCLLVLNVENLQMGKKKFPSLTQTLLSQQIAVKLGGSVIDVATGG